MGLSSMASGGSRTAVPIFHGVVKMVAKLVLGYLKDRRAQTKETTNDALPINRSTQAKEEALYGTERLGDQSLKQMTFW